MKAFYFCEGNYFKVPKTKDINSEMGIIKKCQNQRFQTCVLLCLYAAPLFRKKEPELDSYQKKTPKSRWLVSAETASFEVVFKN